MQQKTTTKIPVGIKSLAKMMAMAESELRFFPKKDELKEILEDYNFNRCTKNKLIERLGAFKAECISADLHAYATGVDGIISAVQYRY